MRKITEKVDAESWMNVFILYKKKVMAQKVVNKRYNYPCMKAQ